MDVFLLSFSLPAFLLIAARIGPLLVLSPILPASIVPLSARLAVVFIAALCTYASGPHASAYTFQTWTLWGLDALRELSVGAVLWVEVSLAFWALSAVLGLVDASASLRSHLPDNPAQTPLKTLSCTLAAVLFALHDGHLWVILAFSSMLDRVPLGDATLHWDHTEAIAALCSLGLQLAAPFLIVFAAIQLLLGSIQRLAPDLNAAFQRVPWMPITAVLGLLVSVSALMQIVLHTTQHALTRWM